MADFQGLARLADMQRRPVGSASSLRSDSSTSTAGSAYRRKAEDYNIATRVLRRQARRGDAGSALNLIKLREEAESKGMSPGGIRRNDEFRGAVAGNIDAKAQAAADLEDGAEIKRRAAQEALAVEPANYTPATRQYAALDMLEGDTLGDDAKTQRGIDQAAALGVKEPERILGRGDRRLTYRQTLDSTLGETTDPAEIAALKERGKRHGVSGTAFDQRAKWWEQNRR